MREETVEFFHQSIMFVIVMFDSITSANALFPDSPIKLEMECDSIIIN